MKVRALLSSVVVLATMGLAGCGHYTCGTTFGNATCATSGGGISQGGGSNKITQTAFVYFVDDAFVDMAAEGLDVSNSGAFLPLSSFASPTLPTSKVGDGGSVVVNKNYLYLPFSNNTLYGFSINGATGALTPVSASSPYSVLDPKAVTADPTGRFVFVSGTAGISAFTVNATDGTLTSAASPVATTTVPTQLVTDGQGKYLYALEGTIVVAYSYNAVGVLTPVGTLVGTTALSQIEGESSGLYILGITGQDGSTGSLADNHIYVFGIGPSGALTELNATATTYSPVYMAVSPNGKFVYTFNENAALGVTQPDPMEGYSINSSTGALAPVSGSPFTTLTASIGKFDQSGQYLFVDAVDAGIGGAFAYAADTTTGALTSSLPHLGFPSTNFAVTDAP